MRRNAPKLMKIGAQEEPEVNMDESREDEGMDDTNDDDDMSGDKPVDPNTRCTTPSPRRRRTDNRNYDTNLDGNKTKLRDNKPAPPRPPTIAPPNGQATSIRGRSTTRRGDETGMTQTDHHKKQRGRPATPMEGDEDSSEQGPTDVDEDGNLLLAPHAGQGNGDSYMMRPGQVDKRILVYAIRGIDVTEMFSPEKGNEGL